MHSWTHQRKAGWAIVFGIGLTQIVTNTVQIGRRLRRCDSRLETSQHLKDGPRSARIQEIRSVYLRRVDHRHKEIGRVKQQCPVKLRRRYTENGKRMLAYSNGTTHHAAVILKMAMPIRPGEHDVGSAVGAMLIGPMEETAKIRLNA